MAHCKSALEVYKVHIQRLTNCPGIIIIIIIILFYFFINFFLIFAHQHEACTLEISYNMVCRSRWSALGKNNKAQGKCCGRRLHCLSVVLMTFSGTDALSRAAHW